MKGLHHVELYVSSLKQSREFWDWYLDYLGYSLYQEWEQGVSWKIDDCYLVFVQTEDRFLDVSYHRCRTGLNHLAFHARSPQQVDELLYLLEERKVPLLYQDRFPHAGGKGHYALFFEDPDRMKVELVCAIEQ